jgi:hypothetical protein
MRRLVLVCVILAALTGLFVITRARPSPLAGTWTGEVQFPNSQSPAFFPLSMLMGQDKTGSLILRTDGTAFLKVPVMPEQPVTWSEKDGKVILQLPGNSSGTDGSSQVTSSIKMKMEPGSALVGTVSQDQKAMVVDFGIMKAMLRKQPDDGTPDGQATTGEQWGLATQGLQMSISLSASHTRDNPALQVAFRNVGQKDTTLNLGIMLANGRVQIPTNIRLDLTDATGKRRELHVPTPNIAGRVDDYVVPLRSGSIYTLELPFAQLWSPNIKESRMSLSPGKYQVVAYFEGSGAKTNNSDVPGIKLMNFWKGQLRSNVLTFEQ